MGMEMPKRVKLNDKQVAAIVEYLIEQYGVDIKIAPTSNIYYDLMDGEFYEGEETEKKIETYDFDNESIFNLETDEN